ncbi:lipocalin family protein [Thermus scotoductus]|uniref:Carotenoid 1,2-hydratase n=1 Tax=Thermus scotoductus TaxID=37636 RepID=A0A430RUT6_THESC|nr:lipocalin family protein [Thermus scotoductus]RTG92835.1 carotenoid 1,2-hydratase [Thermus scotoductus]RTH23470.1 carotenoid 1,2-hydratase [Thermus scotoductus]
MQRLWPFLLLLGACSPALVGVDPQRLPDPGDWDPKPAQMEWWYASGWVEPYAFHFAFFKAYAPPSFRILGLPGSLFGAFHAGHLALTDLRTGERIFLEVSDQDLLAPRGRAEAGPDLEVSGWRFYREDGAFRLLAGPVDLRFLPLKPPVVHPPGYSGTEETGRLYYQSYTRVEAWGQIRGEEARGEAWMDHQWGEQLSGVGTTWDWISLHLSDGSELMAYQVKNRQGQVVQVLGSRVDPLGKVEEAELRFLPLERWQSPSGRTYTLAWRLQGPGVDLEVRPLFPEGEILSRTTRVAYWEGPVVGEGILKGYPVRARGMGEFVAGAWRP